MRYFIYCRKSTDSEDRQVLSLPAQHHELDKRRATAWPDVTVAGVFDESQSAKTPGRPKFNEMLRSIKNGEAEGIIAWSPDRLARNSVDAGEIIYLLDLGHIKDLKFGTFTFENTPHGKFFLSLYLSQSKLFVDAMAEDIKKGMREKAGLGWRPTQPPLGYLTNSEDRTIVPDPARFDLIRRMWQMMLSGAYTPSRILHIATNEWGLRTKPKKKRGGGVVSLSTVYAIFGNIFYAGVFTWEGRLHPGKHKPMITLEEFDRVQALLGRPGRPRAKHLQFAYTGLIRCGSCGLAITAEEKINRFGTHYTYYHCTHRKRWSTCRERCISLSELERQMAGALDRITLHPEAKTWLYERMDRLRGTQREERELKLRSVAANIASHQSQLDNLTRIRIRGLLTDEEFVREREALDRNRLGLVQQHDLLAQNEDWIEPARRVIAFNTRAADYFLRANNHIRRLIIETVGSNPSLAGKVFSVEARKPFRMWPDAPVSSELWTLADSNR